MKLAGRVFETPALNTVKLGYNELGYNEHSVITNKFLDNIGHFTTQMNPVITKPGYNEQKWPVASCSTVQAAIVIRGRYVLPKYREY
jgi:hypothetical protein